MILLRVKLLVLPSLAAATAVGSAVAESYDWGKTGMLLLTAALGFLGVWFWRYRDRVEAKRKELEIENKIWQEKTTKLEGKMELVEMQVKPFWTAMQSKIITDLLHPSPQFEEMDILLRKLEDLTLTTPDRQRLNLMLDERIVSLDTEITQEERESAKLLKGVMRKVLAEAGEDTQVGKH